MRQSINKRKKNDKDVQVDLSGQARFLIESGNPQMLHSIAAHPQLTELMLPDAYVTNSHLRIFAHRDQIREINLDRNKDITDRAMITLASIPNLKALSLNGSPISDDGLAQLSVHPRLEELDITNTLVTDSGMKHLVKLKRLREVHIGSMNADVTSGGIRDLLTHRRLHRLVWNNRSYQGPSLKKLKDELAKKE